MEKVDYSGTNAEIGKYPSIFQSSPWKIKKKWLKNVNIKSEIYKK